MISKIKHEVEWIKEKCENNPQAVKLAVAVLLCAGLTALVGNFPNAFTLALGYIAVVSVPLAAITLIIKRWHGGGMDSADAFKAVGLCLAVLILELLMPAIALIGR